MSSWYEALNELIDKSIQEEKEKNTKIRDEFLTAYGVGSGDFRSVSLDSLLPSSNEDEGAETKIESEDMVNHPSHYQGVNGLEARTVHENFVPKYEKYGVMVASDIKDAMKYILRAPDKNGLQDIDKAINMLKYAREGIERHGLH